MSEEEKEFQQNSPVPLDFQTNFKKSNLLISSKYKSSLLENQIMTYALAHIEVDSSGRPCSEIAVKDFFSKRMARKTSTHAIYDSVKKIAGDLGGRYILIEDPENDRFAYINLLQKAVYDNGVLKINFNEELKPLLVNLEKKFTILNYELMLSFSNTYSARLYEILRSKAYEPGVKNQNAEKVYTIRYSLAELMVTIGMVDLGSEKMKKERFAAHPDYERMLEKAPEKMYSTWGDFRRYVLERSVKEINEISDITAAYEPVRAGAGGKIREVIFTVQKKKETAEDAERKEKKGPDVFLTEGDEKKKLTEDMILDYCVELRTILSEKLPAASCRKILEEADYDLEKIRKAYEIAQSAGHIENLAGFLIAAMKNNYEKPVRKDGKRTGRREKVEILDRGETYEDVEDDI